MADAGSNEITVSGGEFVELNGSNSSDPDNDIVSYQWEQLYGEKVVLEQKDTAIARFLTPKVTAYGLSLLFQLTVTDADKNVDTDQVTVNIIGKNMPPVADAGQDQTVFEKDVVVLDGADSSDLEDSPRELGYLWTQMGGEHVELNGAATSTPSFIAPKLKSTGMTLTFKLEVKDSSGLWAEDECHVNIVRENNPPVAVAGDDQQVAAGEEVVLDGSTSWDPEGNIRSYRWKQLSGTTVHLDNPKSAVTGFVATRSKKATKLRFRLTVADEEGLKATDTCDIDVTAKSFLHDNRQERKEKEDDESRNKGDEKKAHRKDKREGR